MMPDACLMVYGSWLKAHGSWPREARGGSWLMARGRSGPGTQGQAPGPGPAPPAPGSPGSGRPLAMSLPWPPLAMSHVP